jgi:dTDP-4-dehydrorhamnose reductase|tara:strand:- start:119 stop:835 length:717 start_codon:yes stop_codon:yes gene_type:complete
MTILVTGGNTSLSKELKKIYDDILIPDSKELDLTNKKNIEQFFSIHDFNCIIHNESLMNVRECEENKSKAEMINVTSTKILVNLIQQINPTIKFIHLSTPCIFDGKEGMYVESSVPCPTNFYGLTRMSSEIIVQKLQNYCIIRTNYVSKEKWPYKKAFVDRFGTYLFTEQVAKGILDLKEENISGIVHLVGDKKISMYELAKLTTPEIQPMTMNDYVGPQLTVDMSLDTKRWKKYKIN